MEFKGLRMNEGKIEIGGRFSLCYTSMFRDEVKHKIVLTNGEDLEANSH